MSGAADRPRTRERSLAGYLLLPRPGDLVKAWIFPAAFALGAVADGTSAEEAARAAVVWAVLELLVYQARYQWNDIRGFDADQRHPEAAARGRLPGPARCRRERIRASVAVAAARLAGAAALALLLPSLALGGVIAALAAAVFGVAALYEALRARATGTSDRVPPPLRPSIVALWLAVGGGYAIRGVSGLALATGLTAEPALALAAAVTAWSFGVAFVTGRWAIEALAFARRDGDGSIAWRARAEQAREHSLALVRWLPAARDGGADLAGWRPLPGTRLSAPWNAAALVAAVAAAVMGRLLAGPADAAEAMLAALAGGLLAAGALAAARRRAARWALAGLALIAAFAALDSPRPLLAALPWVAVVGAHLLFAAQSPRTVTRPLRAAIEARRPALAASSRRPPTPSLSRR
jgi:hypothetical protein